MQVMKNVVDDVNEALSLCLEFGGATDSSLRICSVQVLYWSISKLFYIRS
jgi:hypothetical protein